MSTWWIKLWRSSQENELYFSEPFTRRQAWQDMIILASHTDWSIIVRWNIIQVKRWQLGHSERSLSERWKRSRGKVRRFLKHLETVQQIVQHKSKVKSLITIKNYEKFQGNSTTDSTTDGHYKEYKEDKEGKKQGTGNKKSTQEKQKETLPSKHPSGDSHPPHSARPPSIEETQTARKEFRSIYPNKVKEDGARVLFIKKINEGILAEDLMQWARNYSKWIAMEERRRWFMTNPINRLNDGCWKDKLDTWPTFETEQEEFNWMMENGKTKEAKVKWWDKFSQHKTEYIKRVHQQNVQSFNS